MGDFEVAVLGGGVAGAVAAIVLAAAGRRVVIVESEATPAWRIGETLAPEARPLLQELGVWDEFTAAGHLPCHGVCSRWGSERVLAKDHIFNPHGNAWQLDRAAFGALLLAAARRAGAQVLSGVACDGVNGSGGNWRVRAGELELRAGVLVDATGRRAMLARSLGVKRHKADRLVSIHGLLAPPVGTADRDARTHIESTPEGWWYSSLTPGGRIVAYQTDADLLPAEQDWRREDWFLERLAGSAYLSSLVVDAPVRGLAVSPRLTSAHSGRLERFAGDGWLAAGDAAMSFDPLSGQGMLKAMRSGLAVSAAINGRGTGFEGYQDACLIEWQAYVRDRQSYYRDETRWRDFIFWQRRDARG